jgi:hypothetical protein
VEEDFPDRDIVKVGDLVRNPRAGNSLYQNSKHVLFCLLVVFGFASPSDFFKIILFFLLIPEIILGF